MKNDGGPAFPITGTVDSPIVQGFRDAPRKLRLNGGMTLRDYFAAAALQSLITMMALPAGEIAKQRLPLAEDAYLLADAMLAERSKE